MAWRTKTIMYKPRKIVLDMRPGTYTTTETKQTATKTISNDGNTIQRKITIEEYNIQEELNSMQTIVDYKAMIAQGIDPNTNKVGIFADITDIQNEMYGTDNMTAIKNQIERAQKPITKKEEPIDENKELLKAIAENTKKEDKKDGK